LGNLFKNGGAASAESGAGGKKESFDDFFESLMKGQSQNTSGAGGAAAPGGVNLDAILSSLNKPSNETKRDQPDFRFTQLFQKKRTEKKSQQNEEFEHQADALADDLLDDEEFAEFMKTLKPDFKPEASPGAKAGEKPFPKAFPRVNLEMPSEFPDLSRLTPEAAKEKIAQELIKANPHLVKDGKLRGAVVSRSQMEEDMAETDPAERAMLASIPREIEEAYEMPQYVKSVKIPNPETGTTWEYDILDQYDDRGLAAMAEKSLRDEAKRRGVSEDEVIAELASGTGTEYADEETARLFQAMSDESKRIEDMQYWSLFPTDIKRWLIYTRTPKGSYNDHGEWVSGPELSSEELIQREADVLGLSPEDLESPPNPADSPFASSGEDLLDQADETGATLDEKLERMEGALEKRVAASAEARKRQQLEDSNDGAEEEDDFTRAANSNWKYWEGVYDNEQQYLPEDLQGKFRFHVQPEEIAGMHPRLRRHFSFKFATEAEITKFRSAEYIRKWGRHPGDSGNSAVQIAILSLRINHLTKTLRTNPTDSHNGYRLQLLVKRRKALMKHLKRGDLMTYYSLLKDIKLRDQVELWTASRK